MNDIITATRALTVPEIATIIGAGCGVVTLIWTVLLTRARDRRDPNKAVDTGMRQLQRGDDFKSAPIPTPTPWPPPFRMDKWRRQHQERLAELRKRMAEVGPQRTVEDDLRDLDNLTKGVRRDRLPFRNEPHHIVTRDSFTHLNGP